MPNNNTKTIKTVRIFKAPEPAPETYDVNEKLSNFNNLTLVEKYELVDVITSDLKKAILGSSYVK
jgi:hypothetical protein